MTLNKFCPVAQGEYYNNKSLAKSQHFFTYFFIFLYMVYAVITVSLFFRNILYF